MPVGRDTGREEADLKIEIQAFTEAGGSYKVIIYGSSSVYEKQAQKKYLQDFFLDNTLNSEN